MANVWWKDAHRWSIIYGNYSGIEATAITEFQRILQFQAPYVIQTLDSKSDIPQNHNLAIIGTAANNKLIADLLRRSIITLPDKADSYAVKSMKDPANEKRMLLIIAGSNPSALLYAVNDFAWRYQNQIAIAYNDPKHRHIALENLPSFEWNDWPRIQDRGIWTWGYVIYDYKSFIKNMAKLRFNMLTIWNDHVPLNAAEIIDYAHSNGIKIVFGFHWGWGIGNAEEVLKKLSSPEGRAYMTQDILNRYSLQYADLKHDGIYFQSATEHSMLTVGERSVAAIMCDFVNETSRALWEKYPHLSIQFGLHATSVRENYNDLAPLHKDIIITWEDAGATPFTYSPITSVKWGDSTIDTTQTLELSKKLASFRPNTIFGIVPKGWMNLDWGEEFENHGPFILGERNPSFITERLISRKNVWARHETSWIPLYPNAMRYYREMLNYAKNGMLVTGLIEDGLFEATIPYCVSVFAQTIWNPQRTDTEILQAAITTET